MQFCQAQQLKLKLHYTFVAQWVPMGGRAEVAPGLLTQFSSFCGIVYAYAWSSMSVAPSELFNSCAAQVKCAMRALEELGICPEIIQSC